MRELLAAIIDSSDDAIISKNLNGIITSWNKSAERLFGYTAEEAIGKSITMLIPAERQDEEPQILQKLRRGERVDHFETIRVRKDGTRLNISLTISPVKSVSGEIVGASKIARDITQQKRAEAALRESEEKLRRMNEELEDRVAKRTAELLQSVEHLKGFTYSIAHDLRQSIRNLVVNAQMVNADYADRLDTEGRESLVRVAESGKKMSQLVDDLLRYARAGDQKPRREMLDVTAMVMEVATEAKDKYGDCQIAVQAGLEAWADPALLRHVFENLVDNACKYGRPDQPVEVMIGHENGVFFVRDNGIGFEQAYAAKVFQPFERLHTAAYEGTGIGLANAKRVVEKHGGRIWAESSPGMGATFYFTLGEDHQTHEYNQSSR